MDVLVINCGSSSIKYQLFDMEKETVLAKGLVEKIGEEVSGFKQETPKGTTSFETPAPDHEAGLQIIARQLMDKETGVISGPEDISAVGHRVVHGGEAFVDSCEITEDVIETIREFFPLAPLHNPPNLTGIEAAKKIFQNVPHVAVFDTSFHQTMPEHAYMYALPYDWYEKNRVRRYGFHGTSHRFVAHRAADVVEIPRKDFNCITCHLGNGCSIAAVRAGDSIDTSMGLTPLEGVVMGTRCGDIDPAIIFYIGRELGLSNEEIDKELNKKSGLMGVSGVSNDMRTVTQAAKGGNHRAELALQVFAYRVKKYIGAYVAVLGKTDAVVFTGGIGENDAAMRARICSDLDFLGITLDDEKNAATHAEEAVVSVSGSRIRVMVVPTNEELMIARDTRRIAESA